MERFLDGMRKEAEELAERIKTLEDFIFLSHQYRQLTPLSASLALEQLTAMRTYSEILSDRIGMES